MVAALTPASTALVPLPAPDNCPRAHSLIPGTHWLARQKMAGSKPIHLRPGWRRVFDDLGAARETREVKGTNYEAGRVEGRPVYRGPTAGKPATHPLSSTTPFTTYTLPLATLRLPPLVVHPQKGGRREGIDDGGWFYVHSLNGQLCPLFADSAASRLVDANVRGIADTTARFSFFSFFFRRFFFRLYATCLEKSRVDVNDSFQIDVGKQNQFCR